MLFAVMPFGKVKGQFNCLQVNNLNPNTNAATPFELCPTAICTLAVNIPCVVVGNPYMHTSVKWFQKHSVEIYNSNGVKISHINYNLVVQNSPSDLLVVDNNASQSIIINTQVVAGPLYSSHNYFQYYYELWDGATYVGTSDSFEIDMNYVQYDNGFPAPYVGLCDYNKIKVDAPNMIGQQVDWYMDESLCSANGGVVLPPCVSLPNPALLISTSSRSLNYTVAGGYEYKIWYKVYPYSTSNCTTQYQSGDIVVRVPYKFDIYQSSQNTTGSTIEIDARAFVNKGGISGRYPNYRNYQWYRNGQQISGANSSSYIVTLPGNYYMKAYSDCGLKTSSTITYDFSNPPWTTYTSFTNNTNFTSNQTITGNVIVGSDVQLTIDPNVTVEIKNGVMMMDYCSQINVSNGTNTNGALLKLTSLDVAACGTAWYGVVVNGASSQANSANKHGKVIIDAGSIRGALLGLRLNDGGIADVSNYTLFEDNNTHVAILDYSTDKQSSTFNNVKFSYLGNTTNSYCNALPSYNNSSYHKFIYIKSCYGPFFNHCSFDNQNNIIAQPTNAIEGYTLNSSNMNIQALDIEYGTFIGDFDRAIKLETFSYVKVYNSSFDYNTGTIGTGVIYVKNGSDLDFENNTIANNITPANGAMAYSTGIYAEQMENTKFRLNDIRCCSLGVEYYQPSAVTITSYLTRNTFLNCSTGVVISPQCNPLGNVSCNTATTLIKLLMRCNSFTTINGIVGSGNLMKQEFSIGGNTDWANSFNCSIWDFAWENISSGGLGKPIIYYNNGIHTLNAALPNNISILINNVAIQNSNVALNTSYEKQYTTYTNGVAPQGGNCSGSLAPFFSVFEINKEGDSKAITIWPNPASGEFMVTSNVFNLVNMEVYDMTGKLITTTNQTSIENGHVIKLKNMPTGVYHLIIRNTIGEIIQEDKLVNID